jgi:hypothetical protein
MAHLRARREGFDVFVTAVTFCQPFCDGRHILLIASALSFFHFHNCRSGGPAIAAGSPSAQV